MVCGLNEGQWENFFGLFIAVFHCLEHICVKQVITFWMTVPN